MLRKAPGRVRLEDVVLKHKVMSVRPVVGDLPCIVIAHHVDALALSRLGAWAAVGIGRRAPLTPLSLTDEAIHEATGDVRGSVSSAVRAARVHVAGAMK